MQENVHNARQKPCNTKHFLPLPFLQYKAFPAFALEHASRTTHTTKQSTCKKQKEQKYHSNCSNNKKHLDPVFIAESKDVACGWRIGQAQALAVPVLAAPNLRSNGAGIFVLTTIHVDADGCVRRANPGREVAYFCLPAIAVVPPFAHYCSPAPAGTESTRGHPAGAQKRTQSGRAPPGP